MLGNGEERKRILTHTLRLWREREDDRQIAVTLRDLSGAERVLGLYKEGIEHVKEAMEIFERLGETEEQGHTMGRLAALLHKDDQLDAAEETTVHAIELLQKKGRELLLCRSHRDLGDIYHSKGEKEKAIHHLEVALGIAAPFAWHDQLFWIRYSLALLFFDENKFDDAHAHIEKAKSHAANRAYSQGCAMELHAQIWFRQHRLDEARSEALRALGTYEKLGLTKDVEGCRNLLLEIEGAAENRPS
jgi:tetratricopeptide (TPR) repeat protein